MISTTGNPKWIATFIILAFSIFLAGCNNQNNEEVYNLGFEEAEHIDIPRTMYVDTAEIRVYPYENAKVINSINHRYVTVHTKVINDNREEWALVEVIDNQVNIRNYGYVRTEKLVKKHYEPEFKCDTESISGVAIGDIVEKAITQFGTDYARHKTELGWSYSFKDGIYIGIDPISNTVRDIIVRAKGFKTKEGIQVGDNAKKAINIYKNKYEMNTDEHLLNEYPESTFSLGDGYYLQMTFDTEELTDDSVITEIYLFNISDGDY